MRFPSTTLLPFVLALTLARCGPGITDPTPDPNLEIRYVVSGGLPAYPARLGDRLEVWRNDRVAIALGSTPLTEKSLQTEQLRALRALVHGRDFQALLSVYVGNCVDANTLRLEVARSDGTRQVVESRACGYGSAVLQSAIQEAEKVRALLLAPGER